MKPEEAKQLLESPVFNYAVNEATNYYLDRIKQRPTEDVEAAIALSVIDRIVSIIESAVMDERISEYNKAEAQKYQ